MSNIEQGIRLARQFTDELNHICKTEGGIQRDEARIWDILHGMNTDEWDNLISTLEAVAQDDASCLYPNDVTVLKQARHDFNKSLAQGKDFVGRPLVAKSGNKRTVWQVTMMMREVINRYSGVHVPNRPNGKPKSPPSRFGDLFDPEH